MTDIGQILVKHLSCIGDLPEPDRSALLNIEGRIERLPRLTDCLREGDRPTEAVLVLKGMLYRHSVSHQGTRQILSFYLPSEAPCLETLYIDYMDNSLGAVVNSIVGYIPHEQLYRIIQDFPQARKLLWRQTLVQGAIFREWLVRNSNQPADAAMAHLFCELYARAHAASLVHAEGIDLPLPQNMLASALGLTDVHVNRTLQSLRQTGAVEFRNARLQMLDYAKLAEIAHFDPKYLHLRH